MTTNESRSTFTNQDWARTLGVLKDAIVTIRPSAAETVDNWAIHHHGDTSTLGEYTDDGFEPIIDVGRPFDLYVLATLARDAADGAPDAGSLLLLVHA